MVLMYGENDWMDVKGGNSAKKRMDQTKEQAISTRKSRGEEVNDEGETKVLIIKKAGHHVYLDSPDEFNEVMMKEMEDVERKTGAKVR